MRKDMGVRTCPRPHGMMLEPAAIYILRHRNGLPYQGVLRGV